MSKLELIRAFYDYNEWANDRLLSVASSVTQDDFSRPQGTSWGSVEASFGHIVGAQIIWLSRWLTGRNPSGIAEVQKINGLDGIRREFDASHAALRDFVAGLTVERLDAILAFTDSRGNPDEQVLWQLMLHVANHGTYHRGEGRNGADGARPQPRRP